MIDKYWELAAGIALYVDSGRGPNAESVASTRVSATLLVTAHGDRGALHPHGPLPLMDADGALRLSSGSVMHAIL
jgi:hypothetical protein